MSDNEQSSITVKVGRYEVLLTEDVADSLALLQQNDGDMAKDFVTFVDTVATELATMGEYKPSEEGKQRVFATVAAMKENLYHLVNENTYERYQ